MRPWLVTLITICLLPAIYAADDKTIFELIEAHDNARLQDYINRSNHLEQTDKSGYTPLFYAVTKNRYRAVEILLSAGAEPNTFNLNGYTPLSHAVHSKRHHLVRTLIRAGANIHLQDAGQKTALQRITEPTCHGKIVHWGTEIDLLTQDPHNDLLAYSPVNNMQKIECPIITMQGKNDEGLLFSTFRLGYPSFPSRKVLDNGHTLLFCDVDILNTTAEYFSKEHPFTACEQINGQLRCLNNNATTTILSPPLMKPHLLHDSDFAVAANISYQFPINSVTLKRNESTAETTTISITAKADIPIQEAHIKLPISYRFDSCKIFNGSWYCEN